MKQILFSTLKIIAGVYVLICILLFFFQEKLIFFPEKLDKDFDFNFDQNFEEVNLKTRDHKLLHGILFKAESSKGVIFYLHGNAGALNSWGDAARTYTDLNYDVFMLDYRGYGKSEGKITGQKQFFEDVQVAYDYLKTIYSEKEIIVLGYSIGTGPAAKVASANNPALLILQAPYYSLTDLVRRTFPIIPTFILKYKFETGKYLAGCNMPIVVFHGEKDEVIPYNSALKLKGEFMDKITLIPLHRQGHNGITENRVYRMELRKLLAR